MFMHVHACIIHKAGGYCDGKHVTMLGILFSEGNTCVI